MSAPQRDTMLLPTPFHSRVEAMCELNDWGNWMGYTTPNAFFDVELEYFAIRSTTGVFDLSPMNKYRITGPDAEAFLNRMVTRNVSKLGVNRVGYAVWCNDAGEVMDDGTIFRLGEQDFRLCSYQRADDWLHWCTLGFDVTISNESEDIAGLAVQGPTSCTVLKLLGCTDLDQLKPFGIAHFSFEGAPMMVSRTGFTGDLGWELHCAEEDQIRLYSALLEAAKECDGGPVGGRALGSLRIEKGYGSWGREYSQEYWPQEVGLAGLIKLDKDFLHKDAYVQIKDNAAREVLSIFEVEVTNADASGGEPIFTPDGAPVGRVTSG